MKDFEFIEENHFILNETCNKFIQTDCKLKAEYDGYIESIKPHAKNINAKFSSTAKKREINIDKDLNKLESHSVSSSSKFGKNKLGK